MSIKKNYLKYTAIALVIIFLIAAAFLLLEVWEKNRNKFPVTSTEDGVITYDNDDYIKKSNIETFLVIGLDRYKDATSAESHDNSVQADFLMLIVFDNDSKQSTAIHINRDTMTRVNKLSVGGASVVETTTKQIALAYNNVNDNNDKIRCRNTKDAVEYLLKDIKIDHYLALTMDSISAGCNLVGGVEVTVLDDFKGIDDTLIKGEKVTLTGEQALTYVRTRYGLEDSSNSTRMARQQQFINALYNKLISCINADEGFVLKLINTMDDYAVYDSSDQKMIKFGEKFKDYEFLGIREIEGESKLGEEFIEFYPNDDSLWEIVLDLFYTKKQ
ncbi:MAG: hypothetical protein E7480_00340 [Ruminococcaceae bacterium]|nr:hypothetical protein [Oscillospiraceae bacterium]